MTVFAGIDLAWTPHRESGICVLEGDADRLSLLALEARVVTVDGLGTDLASHADIVAAIDAPLIIGPDRTAEREVGRLFGKYKASVHAANEALFVATGRMAGPNLGRALGALRFDLDPRSITPKARGRFAFECYPHAQHVVLFGLAERIPYKRKKGRNVAFVREQFVVLQKHLTEALKKNADSLLADVSLRTLLALEAVEARGTALKAVEDQLDALTCALAAYLGWRDGMTARDVVGDPATGYIAVPGLRGDPRFVRT